MNLRRRLDDLEKGLMGTELLARRFFGNSTIRRICHIGWNR